MEQYTDKYKEIDEAFAAQQRARFGKLPPPIEQRVHIGPLDVRIQHFASDENGRLFCVGMAFRPYDIFNSKSRHEILKKEGYRLWKLCGIPNYHGGIQEAESVKEILRNDLKIKENEKTNTTIYKIDLEDQKLIANAAGSPLNLRLH